MQRREMMVGGDLLGAALAAARMARGPGDGIVNPVVRQSADAQVFRHRRLVLHDRLGARI
jgi:hypothetical protein